MVSTVTYFIAVCCKEILVPAPWNGEIIMPKHVRAMSKDSKQKL